MNKKNSERSAVWGVINWAIIQSKIKTHLAIGPDQLSIEKAIQEIENKHSAEDLFIMEIKDLENLLVDKISYILQKNRGKEIKKKINNREKLKHSKHQRTPGKVGIKIMPFGNMKKLKDLDIDPDMMEQLSKSMMEQLFGKKRKKKDDDDDDDDQPGASFYM